MSEKNKKSIYGRIEDSIRMEDERNIHLARVISLSVAILGLCIMAPLSYFQGNMEMFFGSR